jgi:DNA-binding CsgD family transcriptional regulator
MSKGFAKEISMGEKAKGGRDFADFFADFRFAASRGAPDADAHDPHHRLISAAQYAGFDSVSYFLFQADPQGNIPSTHWSSAGPSWCERYRADHYHDVDPRLIHTQRRLFPLVWDQDAACLADGSARFLAQADGFGIRSGVAISMIDARFGRAVVCWDSAAAKPDAGRLSVLHGSLGDLVLVTADFLEISVGRLPAVQPRPMALSLTPRERECLTLAANGMTSGDIGFKLGISTRTANFHFANITAKLAVLNRGEAIARAISQGLIPNSDLHHASPVQSRA